MIKRQRRLDSVYQKTLKDIGKLSKRLAVLHGFRISILKSSPESYILYLKVEGTIGSWKNKMCKSTEQIVFSSNLCNYSAKNSEKK